jgi:hypothetical protein
MIANFFQGDNSMSQKTVLALACLVLAPIALSQDQQKKTQDEPVHATGCVEQGVEAGCLVLKDIKTKTLYDLKFDKKPAPVGTAIEFDGVSHAGEVDHCQQGKIVHIQKWSHIRMHCPPPEAEKKAPAQ